MFKLLTSIPKDIFVAVSGGPDSMAVLDFLRRKHNITAVHFNHGTEHGKEAEEFVIDVIGKMSIPLIVGRNTEECPKGQSKEKFWRDKRYSFFKDVAGNKPLVLAHTLDDAMETWIFTGLQGKSKLIPIQRDNIIRPFLSCRKADMLKWCQDKGVPFILDPGNKDVKYPRVRIRLNILPELLKVNPGFSKVIYKMYLKEKEQKIS